MFIIKRKGEKKTGAGVRPITPALANQEKRIYPDALIISQISAGYNRRKENE